MTNCKYITKNGRCGLKGSYAYRHGCFGEDMCGCREPMTNADRIRAMPDKELAKFLYDFFWGRKEQVRLFNLEKWLQMPSEEEDHA